MNATEEAIIATIYETIDEINEQLPPDNWLRKSPDAAVLGRSGGLDSLGFVTFVAALEEKCEERFGVMLSLADSGNGSADTDEFDTVASLARFVAVYDRTIVRLNRRIEYVDLRYPGGFAVRIPELRDGAPRERRKGRV